jgi:hypothetical protein
VRDGRGLDQRVAFAAAECRAHRASGIVRCTSRDRLREARFSPRGFPVAGYRFALRLSDLPIRGPFGPPLTVRVASDPPLLTEGLDRVGATMNCRVTPNGMICRSGSGIR